MVIIGIREYARLVSLALSRLRAPFHVLSAQRALTRSLGGEHVLTVGRALIHQNPGRLLVQRARTVRLYMLPVALPHRPNISFFTFRHVRGSWFDWLCGFWGGKLRVCWWNFDSKLSSR